MTDNVVRQHWEPKNLPLQIESYEKLIAEVPGRVAELDTKIQKLESIADLRAQLPEYGPKLQQQWEGLRAQHVQIARARGALQIHQDGVEAWIKQKNIALDPDPLDEVYAELTKKLGPFLAAVPHERNAMRETLTPLISEALLKRIGTVEPRRWGLIRTMEKSEAVGRNTNFQQLAELYHQQGIAAELFGQYLVTYNERDALAKQIAPVLKQVGKGVTVAMLEQEKEKLEAQKLEWEQKLEALRNPPPPDDPVPGPEEVPGGDGPPPPTCSKGKLAIVLSVVVALAVLTYLVLRNRSSVATP